MNEPSLADAYQDVHKKADLEILQRSSSSLWPIIGEEEIKFLKKHGILDSLLDGHEKFIQQGKSRVGHLIIAVPDLLQETGIMRAAQ